MFHGGMLISVCKVGPTDTLWKLCPHFRCSKQCERANCKSRMHSYWKVFCLRSKMGRPHFARAPQSTDGVRCTAAHPSTRVAHPKQYNCDCKGKSHRLLTTCVACFASFSCFIACCPRFPYIFNFLYAWHLFSIQYRNPVILFPGRRFVCWILSLCLKQWGLIN